MKSDDYKKRPKKLCKLLKKTLEDEKKAGYKEYPELGEIAKKSNIIPEWREEIAKIASDNARDERRHFAIINTVYNNLCKVKKN